MNNSRPTRARDLHVTSHHRLNLLWTPASGLPARTRLRLFREARLATAAVGLGLFPILTFAVGEPVGVTLALLLASLLPAVIALDTRRPAGLDRAVTLHVTVVGAVLTAGMLKGLPAAAAAMLLALACVEALAAVRPRGRKLLAMAAVAGLCGMCLAAGHPAGPHAAGAAASLAAVLLALAGAAARARGLALAAQEQAAMHRERMRASDIESVVSETVLALDRSGGVVRASRNTPRTLGLPSDSLLGRGLFELTLVADRPALLAACADCAVAVARRTLRLRLRESVGDAQPRYRWAEISLEPAVDGLSLVSLRDISVDVLEEERRSAAAKEAEAARQARAAFLTTVNHELRTPLNAIIGFSEILANPGTAPVDVGRVREYAGIVNSAGQDLLRMVSAMIDITRIDSGIYEFEIEDTDLTTLIESAVEAFRQETEALGESFTVMPAAGPIFARVDARAVRGVLHQVFSNAAKFGRGKGVTVALSTDAMGVAIIVRDRGEGIAPDKLRQLGRHFERLDEGLGRERGGIGLGLALARGLMALNGGRISIDSAPGRGTAVTLHFGGAARPTALANVLTLDAARKKPDAATPSRRKERRRA
jgi:two-component system, cell cycle sensor histidine kinase DivJ